MSHEVIFPMQFARREFLQGATAAVGALAAGPGVVSTVRAQPARTRPAGGVELVDTNVHVFEWPFRKLKHSSPEALARRLRSHGVTTAWTASFEALLAKDIAGVNERLVEACRRIAPDFFVPVGAINPLWPGWEEDLRRCHEEHRLDIIRLHPAYQGYTLEAPEFAALLARATERRMLVQIVLEMEDSRVHHPALRTPAVNPAPLGALLDKIPAARVQLLGDRFGWMRAAPARPLLRAVNLSHDFSSLESVGGVSRLIRGRHGSLSGKIPLERLAFGSHAPFYPVESALLKLFESPFSAPERQALMAGNARRLRGV